VIVMEGEMAARLQVCSPLAATLMAIFVAAACSPQPSPSDASSVEALPDPPIGGEDGPTFLEQWQAGLPGYRSKASAFERRLLADGIVTEAEHEAAIAALIDCIRRAGFSDVGAGRARSGLISALSVGGSADSTDVVLGCQAEFYTYASQGFKATTWDPDGTEAERLRELARCIREGGIIEVPPEPTSFRQISNVVKSISFSDHQNVRDAQGVSADCVNREWW
jgi:hypothetical protein